MGKVAVLSTLAGIALLWAGVHDMRVGLAARDGPTPTACDGPVTAPYLELRDCIIDFREAVPYHSEEGELAVVYVPVRSSPEHEAAIVLRIKQEDPMFGTAAAVLDKPLHVRVHVPREKALGSLTTVAKLADYRPDTSIRSELWSRRTSRDFELIDLVTEQPTTPWGALLELGGGLLCLVVGIFAWVGTVREFKQEFERLQSDADR